MVVTMIENLTKIYERLIREKLVYNHKKTRLLSEKEAFIINCEQARHAFFEVGSKMANLKIRNETINRNTSKLFLRNIRLHNEFQNNEKLIHKLSEEYSLKKELYKNAEREVKRIDTEISNLDQQYEHDLNLLSCISIYNGRIMINDTKLPYGFKSLSDGGENKGIEDELILIHATNRFPEYNTILTPFNGNKPTNVDTITYRGVTRKTISLNHRCTVHFSLNHKVKDNDGGSWRDMQYIIIDFYNEHSDEMCSKGQSPILYSNDIYTTTMDNFSISRRGIILVPKDCILSEEILHSADYNIVFYDGNQMECVDNIMKLCNIPKISHNYDPPTHKYSDYCRSETRLIERDHFINFITGNNYNGKDPITLDSSVVYTIIDYFFKMDNSKYSLTQFIKYFKELGFVTIQDDHRYKLASGSEALDYYRKNSSELYGDLNFENLYKVFIEYTEKLDTLSTDEMDSYLNQLCNYIYGLDYGEIKPFSFEVSDHSR